MKYIPLYLLIAAGTLSFAGCRAQENFGEKYLSLSKKISLPGIKGRIDHLDISLKEGIVYIAALGSDALEIVDLNKGKVVHRISGLDEPQGITYIPQTREIFVANGGTGDCYFYDATTFEKTGSVQLKSDADDVRYDSIDQKIYVGYGRGGIAVIDARNHKLTGDIKLPVHPEGFQVDRKNGLLYVNLPDASLIGVADLKKLKLVRELNKSYRSGNFPMALDSSGSIIFLGYRHPGKLVILNTQNDQKISVTNLGNDCDDLFYDEDTKRIYASCGGAFAGSANINIFQFQNQGICKQIAGISTRNGSRTSLLVPQLHLFLLAEPSDYSHEATLAVYQLHQ